jgi:hypothetical protein
MVVRIEIFFATPQAGNFCSKNYLFLAITQMA